MPRAIRRQGDHINVPVNNTVKLTEPLRVRVAKAMAVEGFTVWSEFCRVSLTEKCAAVESELKTRDPDEYARVYAKPIAAPPARELLRDATGLTTEARRYRENHQAVSNHGLNR